MLKLDDLTKTYDGFSLGPISLDVDDEVLVLLGPSGCGKSTLLSIIAGITLQDAGTVWLNGHSLDGWPPEDRQIGLVFQDGALFPHMTARENIMYAATDPDRVRFLVDALEILDILDQPTPTLSGGERQRVALTRVLAADPDVLLLDEPLANLDTPIRKRLRDELHELFATLSIPVIYVTHDQRAATVLGDRTAILRDGAIEQTGTAADLRNKPATPFVAKFTGVGNTIQTTIQYDGSGHPRLRLGTETYPIDSLPDTIEPRRADESHSPEKPSLRVIACIRSNAIRISAAKEPHETGPDTVTFEGTVNRSIDEGEFTRVECDVRGLNGPLFVTVIPTTIGRGVTRPGTPVQLSVTLDDAHLIPQTE